MKLLHNQIKIEQKKMAPISRDAKINQYIELLHSQIRKRLELGHGEISKTFNNLFKECKRSKEPRHKYLFLDVFNKYISPLLTSEVAFMDMLASFNCLGIGPCFVRNPNIPIRLHLYIKPKNTISGKNNYARIYRLEDHTVDKKHGGLSVFRFVPEKGFQGNTIYLFSGMALPYVFQDQLDFEAGYPSKLRAGLEVDYESNNMPAMGFNTFQHNEKTILKWVYKDMRASRKSVILGHSLGAVYAQRMYASVIKHLTKYSHSIDVFSFSEPGVDEKLAHSLLPYAKNIHQFKNDGDILTHLQNFSVGNRYKFYVHRAKKIKQVEMHNRADWADTEMDGHRTWDGKKLSPHKSPEFPIHIRKPGPLHKTYKAVSQTVAAIEKHGSNNHVLLENLV
jgi:hypothetical protein